MAPAGTKTTENTPRATCAVYVLEVPIAQLSGVDAPATITPSAVLPVVHRREKESELTPDTCVNANPEKPAPGAMTVPAVVLVTLRCATELVVPLTTAPTTGCDGYLRRRVRRAQAHRERHGAHGASYMDGATPKASHAAPV